MNKKKHKKVRVLYAYYICLYMYTYLYIKKTMLATVFKSYTAFFWSNSTFCQIQIPSNYLIWSVPSLCYRRASLLYRFLCSWLTQAMATANRRAKPNNPHRREALNVDEANEKHHQKRFFLLFISRVRLKRRPMAAKLSGWIRQSAEMNLLAIAAGADEDC